MITFKNMLIVALLLHTIVSVGCLSSFNQVVPHLWKHAALLEEENRHFI